jgi:uncharacterized repeat protein (TIGR01451 family)
MIMKPSDFGIFASAVLLMALNPDLSAQTKSSSGDVARQIAEKPQDVKRILAANGRDWCGTDSLLKGGQNRGENEDGCPIMGPPDLPENRNACIPGPTTPIKVIRIHFNVFQNDDGSNPAGTQADVDAQVRQLNSDYLPYRVQFVASETSFINSSQFRNFDLSEEAAMKTTYAQQPHEQHNIYVVNLLTSFIGRSTFPWDPNSLGVLGGTLLDDTFFGAGQKTLTHELGHALGLWHTHHGVTEVNSCSVCWERADGTQGDTTGDFCSDTPPTPVNFNCAPPGGNDDCSSTPWGATSPQNYMGYADDFCYREFTAQQAGRMHCWIGEKLLSWLSDVKATPVFSISTNIVASGNGNGAIDPNECNDLFIVVTNLSSAGATNLQGRLSTTTPGVLIVNRTSAYPDVSGGGVGTNLTAFKISTSPAFICGTPVSFTLVLTSDNSVQTNQFSLATGVEGDPVRFNNNTSIPIPDSDPAGIISPVTVTNVDGGLQKVAVSLHLTHTYDSDLVIELISPDGTTIALSQFRGFDGDNFGTGCSDANRTTFDDDALGPIGAGVPPFVGTFRPDQSFAVLRGISGAAVNGVWKLHIMDLVGIDVGVLQCWSLHLFPAGCTDGGGQCPGADLAVGMTVAPDPTLVGSNLVYTITVTNNGPDTAKNTALNLPLPGSFVYVTGTTSQGTVGQSGGTVNANLGNLLPLATATIRVTVTPTQAGTFSATASATSTIIDFDLSNNSASASAHVNPPASDMALTMTDLPDPVLAGGTLTYTVVVTNNGPAAANSVVVSNFLPATAAFISANSTKGTVTLDNGVVICNVGTLTNRGGATITIVVRPGFSGTIVASANVTALQFDPIPGNNSVSASTTVNPSSDLAVALAGPESVIVGSNFTYTVTVTNLGPSAATNIVVNDALPGALAFISATSAQGTVTNSNGLVAWTFGSLASGASATLTIIVNAVETPGILNTVSVQSSQADPVSANNTASLDTIIEDPTVRILAAGATLTAESISPANGAVDFGERVTLDLRLRNSGNVASTNLIATLLATGGVSSPTGSQTYGALTAGGLPVAGSFSFTAPTNGTAVTATLQLQDGTVNLGTVTFTFILPGIVTFSNAASITINDNTKASPYPSALVVSNVTGLVGNVSVTLVNVNHTFPDDIDMLLVGPGGQKVVIMSDAGSDFGSPNPLVNTTFTLDSTAGDILPDVDQINAQKYQPANYEPGDVFMNAPPGPSGNSLTVFDGGNANGTWSLYVVDDDTGDVGNIAGGWRLNVFTITPVNKVADVTLTVTDGPDPVLMAQNLTYAFTITNRGPDAASGIAFTNILPAGLTLVSASSLQATVATNGNTVTAAIADLPVGTNAVITIVARPTVSGSINNSASVRAVEADLNLGNNSVTATTIVNPPTVDLALSAVGSPNPVTIGSNLTYTLTVQNNGPQTALGVVLSSTLPAGVVLGPVTPSQGTYTVSGQTVNCNLGVLNAGATANAVIVVSPSVAAMLTNNVSVTTTSSDTNSVNNSAVVVTRAIVPSANIVLAGVTLVSESFSPANGAIDPGETVTVSFALANNGAINASNLVATLQAGGGVSSSSSQSYGLVVTGGTSVARNFTFTANGATGGTVTAILQLQDGAISLGTITNTFSFSSVATFSSTTAITIPASGGANIYPATINVNGSSGLISKVTVNLTGLSHSFPDDLDILLVSPSGQKVMLMSDAGGGHAVSGVNLVFADSASSSLPDSSQIISGSFRPANYGSSDVLASPAPNGPFDSQLAGFNGQSANGTWSLYIFDDTTGDAGSLSGGWSMTITTVNTINPASEMAMTMDASASAVYVGETVNYSINVANNGPNSATAVTLSNPLPAGLSFVSGTSSQGSVTSSGGIVTGNLGNIASGAGASATFVLRAVATGDFTNVVSVSASQADLNPLNNSAAALITVLSLPAPRLLSSAVLTNGQFQFILSGQIGTNYIVQASTNLVNWISLTTNVTDANGTFKFTDSSAAAYSGRYYRALRAP